MIDPGNKCLFVHVPKSAGTFIEHTLMGNRSSYTLDLKDTYTMYTSRDKGCNAIDFTCKKSGKYHMPAKHWSNSVYKQYMHPGMYKNFYKFTFVRNPWVRMHSLYNYMQYNARRKGRSDGNTYVLDYNFPQWIELVNKHVGTSKISKIVSYAPNNGISQLDFIEVNGQNNMDYVGKTETFKDDFKKVWLALGNDPNVLNFERKINQVKKVKTPWEAYTPKSKEIVKSLCKRDIEAFGYKFGV